MEKCGKKRKKIFFFHIIFFILLKTNRNYPPMQNIIKIPQKMSKMYSNGKTVPSPFVLKVSKKGVKRVINLAI